MKKLFIRWFVKACMAYSGKTQAQLAKEAGFYYFLYRSHARACWLAVTR